jgi:hypothetical protein
MNRVNRNFSCTMNLFCMCSLTFFWCWRCRSATEQPRVVWKWQAQPMKWAARCGILCHCLGLEIPAESNGKVTSFLLLAVSVTLYSHWTLYILSLTDENIFDIDSMGNILILWADLADKSSRFYQKHKSLMTTSVTFLWSPFVRFSVWRSQKSNLCMVEPDSTEQIIVVLTQIHKHNCI